MPDKKLNNNDIIKALDICSKSTNGCSHSKYTCEDCYLNGQPMCSSVLLQDAIDLHARQQAEIERLKEIIEYKDICIEACEDIKSEVIKNFAEKLKEKSGKVEMVCSGALVQRDYTISEKTLDNLVKEMVGDDNVSAL